MSGSSKKWTPVPLGAERNHREKPSFNNCLLFSWALGGPSSLSLINCPIQIVKEAEAQRG